MGQNEHDCIQTERIKRIEDYIDKVDDKHDKILDIILKNEGTLGKVLARLDKKKDSDKTRNGVIKDEDDRIDGIEIRTSSLEGKMSIILFIVPIMFTIILGIQTIILYYFIMH